MVLGVLVGYELGMVMNLPARVWAGGFRAFSADVPSSARQSVVRCALVAGLGLGFGLFRLSLNGGTPPAFKDTENPAAFEESLLVRTLMFNFLAARHVLVLLWPAQLCCDWSTGAIDLVTSPADARNLLTLLVYAGIAGLAVLAVLRRAAALVDDRAASVLLFSLLMLIMPYIMASNLVVYVGFVLAERVMYLPCLGYAGIISVALHQISITRHRTAKHIGLALCVVLAARTVARNPEWRDNASIFQAAMEVAPNNSKLAGDAAAFIVKRTNLTAVGATTNNNNNNKKRGRRRRRRRRRRGRRFFSSFSSPSSSSSFSASSCFQFYVFLSSSRDRRKWSWPRGTPTGGIGAFGATGGPKA